MGAGLSLVISAGTTLLQPLEWVTPNWADNRLWALFAFLALLVTQRIKKIPYALIIFTLGLIFTIVLAGRSNLPNFKIWRPRVYVPSWTSFKVSCILTPVVSPVNISRKTGALDAGLGQIPLTTLNSIIAVSYLSADLLPNTPAPSVTAMGLSVAGMNLIGGWFGAMPICHGSGGLAAQYRFGARSGASIIALGIFKVLIGFFFGETLVGLLRQYPKSLLGIMVFAAGLELAKVGESVNHGARDLWEVSEADANDPNTGQFTPSPIPFMSSNTHTYTGSGEGGQSGPKIRKQITDEERNQRWLVMLMTIGGLLAFKNDAVGFAAGTLCHWSFQSQYLLVSWTRWRGSRNGENPRSISLEEEESLLSE